eukprot:s2086_g22.t1
MQQHQSPDFVSVQLSGTLLSLFQLPNDPELTCRTLRQKDRITDERLEWKVRSKTEVFSPSKLARSNTLERMLLRQYSMQASDKTPASTKGCDGAHISHSVSIVMWLKAET